MKKMTEKKAGELQHRLSMDEIENAKNVINPIFKNSPQYECSLLGKQLSLRLFLKVETLNPAGSFKGRGADYLIKNRSDTDKFICASAGNFGLAMALACRQQSKKLTVYAAHAANPYKVEMIRSLGAQVVLIGKDFDEAKEKAKQAAQSEKICFVEDGMDIETLAGAATIGIEWLQQVRQMDAVLIPLGNGALFTGIARVLRHYSPSTRLITVQAEGARAMTESIIQGNLITFDSVNTIADGIAVRTPIPQALEDINGMSDACLLVNDDNIIKAMKLIHEKARIITEPSGAIGIGAMLQYPAEFARRTVGTVLCGANVTDEQFKLWFQKI